MKCAWESFLRILPQWMRKDVDEQGCQSLQELRLRLDKPPELITTVGSFKLKRSIELSDLEFCVNTASRYSPWAAQSIANGYITAPGGHRIGLCGQATVANGKVLGIRELHSLCLRVARDFPGIAMGARGIRGSILIIGAPGSGKTTLLRDLIRIRSEMEHNSVAVVDEKGEIFPGIGKAYCFDPGSGTDILTGCSKEKGIDMVLRNMGPGVIAVDEITAEEDCRALESAAWCGVDLLATAHAANRKELYSRKVYASIVQNGIFDHLLVLRKDKTWYTERMVV